MTSDKPYLQWITAGALRITDADVARRASLQRAYISNTTDVIGLEVPVLERCLLVAAKRLQRMGQNWFNFEMVFHQYAIFKKRRGEDMAMCRFSREASLGVLLPNRF